jgi:hypothetical protein
MKTVARRRPNGFDFISEKPVAETHEPRKVFYVGSNSRTPLSDGQARLRREADTPDGSSALY